MKKKKEQKILYYIAEILILTLIGLHLKNANYANLEDSLTCYLNKRLYEVYCHFFFRLRLKFINANLVLQYAT